MLFVVHKGKNFRKSKIQNCHLFRKWRCIAGMKENFVLSFWWVKMNICESYNFLSCGQHRQGIRSYLSTIVTLLKFENFFKKKVPKNFLSGITLKTLDSLRLYMLVGGTFFLKISSTRFLGKKENLKKSSLWLIYRVHFLSILLKVSNLWMKYSGLFFGNRKQA